MFCVIWGIVRLRVVASALATSCALYMVRPVSGSSFNSGGITRQAEVMNRIISTIMADHPNELYEMMEIGAFGVELYRAPPMRQQHKQPSFMHKLYNIIKPQILTLFKRIRS